MRTLATLVLFDALALQAMDSTVIMEKMAANVEAAAEARRQFVYQQNVRTNLIRSDNKMSRWEKRQYTVVPSEAGTRKELISLHGEYRDGKRMVPYSEARRKYKEMDIDAELADDLTDDLVNDKKSKDGIPHSLFPLRSKDLHYYKFTSKGEADYQDRRTYKIAYEPKQKTNCVVSREEDIESDCVDHPWKGEIWVDAVEFQPVRIDSQLAFKIPWAVLRVPWHQPQSDRLLPRLPASNRKRLVPRDLWDRIQAERAVRIQAHDHAGDGEFGLPENGRDLENRIRSGQVLSYHENDCPHSTHSKMIRKKPSAFPSFSYFFAPSWARPRRFS
ncbi:MAG: hypothetical protein JJE04_22300 [Acidobacteriia bacterium]|nr:hypothetical protein [Terriglobia bacterium]